MTCHVLSKTDSLIQQPSIFDWLGELPVQVILSFLSPKTLITARLVSREMKKLADTPWVRKAVLSQRMLSFQDDHHAFVLENLSAIQKERDFLNRTSGIFDQFFFKKQRIKAVASIQKEEKYYHDRSLFHRDRYQYAVTLERSQNIVQELFRPQGGYRSLPVLSVDWTRMGGDYIDFIEPKDMTAPMMRGEDPFHRQFFTIRARMKDGDLYCQTFFERYSEQPPTTPEHMSSRWVNAYQGAYIVNFSQEAWADPDSTMHQELRELIAKGSMTNQDGIEWTLE
jgi:hypothetical protein